MTTFDGLWYLADEATRRAERAYHRTVDRHDGGYLERTYRKYVSRGRFRTLTERITDSGAPYGAHTLVYRPSGELLLVRHEGVGKWVLPGGDLEGSETFHEAARRELREETGIGASYEGLAMLVRVEIACDDHETWGVMPVFLARAEAVELTVADPDDEIGAARWFAPESVPEDTRDREDIIAAANAVA
ncbi:NUDIX hydrolase [Natronomonas marina]|jgi:8-oxo-dGTP diphosphatase|uniref:NUDIX hydrolase n=1 Tax=Natronomonas marina TaxID=2961939 RepID=UPI0020C9F01A|nr:NUDIX domain-containing protein [Natronomonas marina]